MTEKRKRTNYRFRLWSNVKTYVIGFLIAVVAVSVTFVWLTLRDNVKLTIRLIEADVEIDEAEAKVDKSTDQFLPTLDSLIGMTKMANEKLELELRKPNERLGTWEIYTFSAYTSLDDGVNNISAIGLDIGKWSMYQNFVAVAGDSYIEYGDTLIVKWKDGTIKSFTAVDTGGALTVGDPDKAEVDVYMGNDLDKAFEFGIQRLEVWVIK